MPHAVSFPPLRILMTADTVGGVWTYAVELARALGRYKVEITLATMGRSPSEGQRAEAAGIAGLSLCCSDFKLEWMESPWDDVDRAGEWLTALERDLRPDIVHLNGYAHGTLPWRTPVLMVGHSCVLSWWQAVKGCEAPAERGEYRTRIGSGLHAADVVVAPSRAMLSALHRHYGPLRRNRVIYNGLDYRPATHNTRERMVFSAGRLWDEAKNIAALETIAPELDIPVVIAGPNEGRDANPDVLYTGQLSRTEIAAWYRRAAVYALPARYEPFGLSALEAAQAGCALVLGNIRSLREIWGDAAVYVEPDDTRALRDAVLRLAQHDDERARYALRARERARRYTARAMADNYLRMYSALLSRSSRVPARYTGTRQQHELKAITH